MSLASRAASGVNRQDFFRLGYQAVKNRPEFTLEVRTDIGKIGSEKLVDEPPDASYIT